MLSVADSDWLRLHRLANAEFDYRIRQIPPEYWSASTPCDEWDVHALVQHVVVESLLAAAVLGGRDPDEARAELVGDDPLEEGVLGDELLVEDVLGSDPELVWEDAHHEAIAAFEAADLAASVQLSGGSLPVIEYLRQRTADLAVHSWDLAEAILVDPVLDPEVVAAVYEWALPHEHRFAASPAHFEPPVTPPPGADLQTRLLALFGREV